MSPLRQSLALTAVAVLGFLALRSLPDTHCALLHADHQPVIVDGVEFCGVNEEANFYRPRALKFPYVLKVEMLPGRGVRAGRLTLTGEDGRALLDHQLALSHTRKLHLHLRSLARPGYVHLHPQSAADGDWSFEVPADFDLTQGAHAYVDFVPVRGGRVALAEASLPPSPGLPGLGTPAPAPLVAAFSASTARAGESALWRVNLRRTGGGPVKLRPLMGSLGHAALFSAEPIETKMGYAHLHPSLEGGEYDAEPTISFRLRLPPPGDYDLWLHVDDGADRYLRIPVTVTP